MPGWPITLAEGSVMLRPHRRGDARGWSAVRLANEAWLAPWEVDSPLPWRERHGLRDFRRMVRSFKADQRAGTLMPFAVLYGDAFAGQLSIANIVRGSFCSATLGYWIDHRLAGKGIIPAAVAMAVDFALGAAQLHRVEVNIRPENSASIRVVEKLGFRREGFHPRFLYIDAAWRDHISYALTVEDLPQAGLLAHWRMRQSASSS